ncbi:hypothetical protein M9458_050257, partial [Cirrhinus mrigala]
IAVEAPRGTLTTLSCVREGRDRCPCRRSNDEEVNDAASNAEMLHSAPKNRTSEQSIRCPTYTRMSGA